MLPNDLWCADFKGEFQLGNSRYCYPLTVTDQASRFFLVCEAFESTREQGVLDAFHRLFSERALPQAIRTDNGLPVGPQTQKRQKPPAILSRGGFDGMA